MKGQVRPGQVGRGDDVTGRAVGMFGQAVTVCIHAKISQITPSQQIGLQEGVLDRWNAMGEPRRRKGDGECDQNGKSTKVR